MRQVARNQWLFQDETMVSGGGKITFKSVVKGVPNLTCIVSNKTSDVIYPRVITWAAERAVLSLRRRDVVPGRAGTVAQGRHERGLHRPQHVLKVAMHQDPVFGMKTSGQGSLIQVKKGTVVGTTAGNGLESVARPAGRGRR